MTMETMQRVINELVVANNNMNTQIQELMKVAAEAPEVPLNTYKVGF